jgi:hypothetical protein
MRVPSRTLRGGQQRRRAVTLVVVGHRPGPARLHRQARLSAVEDLDLALLVDRADHGVGRRVDIETDDVTELFDEPRVVGELEALHLVRLKAVEPARCVGRNWR